MRALRVLGVVVGVVLVLKLLTAPVVGVALGWALLVYVIVRAAPAVRADVRRVLTGRGGALTEWRF